MTRSTTLAFSGRDIAEANLEVAAYAMEVLGIIAPAAAQAPNAVAAAVAQVKLRDALVARLGEINPDGAALAAFALDLAAEQSLTWPEIRTRIARPDDREALNVLSHLQSFTRRALGQPLFRKQGPRGRTRYALNPAYAA
jgi:hypothetical protein